MRRRNRPGVLGRLAALAPLLLSACAAADAPEACAITKVTDVPLRLVDGVPMLDARVAGRPARLMLDTGAEATVVAETAFARLGLEHDYAHEAYGSGLGARTGSWLSKPATVGLGTLTRAPAPLYAALFTPRPDGTGVDGLLGGDVLSAYDVDIDVARGRLTLYEPRRCPGGPPPFDGPSMTLRATRHGARRLAVPVALNGVEMPALLDTGTTRTLVDARQAGLTPADLAGDRAFRVITPDPVGVVVFLHRFDRLQVGAEVIEHPVLTVGPLRRAGISALLGSDYWRNRRVWISYAGQAVTVGPAQPPPP